jgi:hypothetical protein
VISRQHSVGIEGSAAVNGELGTVVIDATKHLQQRLQYDVVLVYTGAANAHIVQ